MTYVKTNGIQVETWPYTLGQFRKDNSGTSFPRFISEDTLASYGVFAVTQEAIPEYNPGLQKVVEAELPILENNTWVLKYIVVPKTTEELQEETANIASAARSRRDYLLQETDWLALVDNTLTQAMRDYRQALRDITLQPGFPADIIWPIKPST